MKGEIVVECDNGEVRITVNNVKGESCRDLTAAIEKALGGSVISDEPTAEMYERPRERVTHNIVQ